MDTKEENLEEGVFPGCTLEYFQEHKEVLELIKSVEIIIDDKSNYETSLQKFKFIMEQYREQAHLLDSHLEEILEEVIVRVRNVNADMNLKHTLFKYLYMIVSVRGYKVIVKKLPHEVGDLKPVLSMLEEQDSTDLENWQTRYCLLLWLSIIVKIPFDMSRFDTGESGDSSVMQRILTISQTYVLSHDSCNKIAAYLVSQFITRTDVKQVHLQPFLTWCTQYFLSGNSRDDFCKYGPLSALASILKFGKREDILPHSEFLLTTLTEAHINTDSYRLTRRYYVKLIQRLGLTFLKVQIAPWRYKRGNRILSVETNDKAKDRTQDLPTTETITQEEEEDFEVVPQVEEIINELFETLRDKDLTVRWSAAKGLGRVTNRLPKGLADDVIGNVLEYLSPREKDPAWHGACLALAELGKRGLLLPHRLPAAVTAILKALVYDEPKGYCSVGSYIRDAACYVCWAFARAYDHRTLEPFVQDIARGLLIVTCYDKEVNCRRAASAAYQELVGRQGGNLPHGIDILTRADYFSVGLRQSAYLDISVYIAQYDAYTRPFIQHLVARKVEHWDGEIRKLTTKTLPLLVPLDKEYFLNEVIDQLLIKIDSIDLNARHGATLSLGEVVRVLSELGCQIPDQTKDRIRDIVKNYRQKKQLQGLSGEMTRQACCYMIEQLCLADSHIISTDWIVLINESVQHEALSVRGQACEALPVLCSRQYAGDTTGSSFESLIQLYLSQLKSPNPVPREGHSKALGVLPPFMLLPHLPLIIEGLIECTHITPGTATWSFARKNAIEALHNIVDKLSGERIVLQFVPKLFECYLTGVEEYTKDSRGDIGRHTRQASMKALQGLLVTCTVLDPSVLTEDNVNNTMGALLKQAVERIDQLRAVAAEIFVALLHHEPTIPHLAHRQELLSIFKPETISSVTWSTEIDSFPLLSQVLACDTFTLPLLEGFIMSIGGITERLVKYSVKYFLAFVKSAPSSKLLQICNHILSLFKKYSSNDDLIIPMMLFLDKLLSSYVINNVLEESNFAFTDELFKLIKEELNGCRNLKKLKIGVEVYCQLLQFTSTRSDSLIRLLLFLTHPFAFLRKHASLRLYETLMIFSTELTEDGTLTEEDLDRSLKLLSETDWLECKDKEMLRSVRDQLGQIHGVKLPRMKPVQ
uniref:Tubulin-specific chaperone D n=2 Tax=Cacopsylla melanoneura TaxID=428564 RepID=A0A8D8W262_9HEMI